MTTTDNGILRPPGVGAKRRPLHPLPGRTTVQAARAWLQRLRRRPAYRDKNSAAVILKLATAELAAAIVEAQWLGGGR